MYTGYQQLPFFRYSDIAIISLFSIVIPDRNAEIWRSMPAQAAHFQQKGEKENPIYFGASPHPYPAGYSGGGRGPGLRVATLQLL
jgi:hypothetical protein